MTETLHCGDNSHANNVPTWEASCGGAKPKCAKHRRPLVPEPLTEHVWDALVAGGIASAGHCCCCCLCIELVAPPRPWTNRGLSQPHGVWHLFLEVVNERSLVAFANWVAAVVDVVWAKAEDLGHSASSSRILWMMHPGFTCCP